MTVQFHRAHSANVVVGPLVDTLPTKLPGAAWWLRLPPPEPEPARDPPSNSAASATRVHRLRLGQVAPDTAASLLAAAVKARPCRAWRYIPNFETIMRPENLHGRRARSTLDLRTRIECS